jgi:hypothetical protein
VECFQNEEKIGGHQVSDPYKRRGRIIVLQLKKKPRKLKVVLVRSLLVWSLLYF